MTRTIKIAAVQMDANPAPTTERLARASEWVARAAQAGAQLVVLPELFNTGYAYTQENHRRVETLDGPTVTWVRRTAAQQRVHLAGSLMVLEGSEVYNALLLVAPDGRTWRYDKSYPWGWERAYFRGRSGVTVAETDLGNIGMLICWDVAHRGLWQQYAGQVDLMLVASCPPDVGHPTFHFPNGETVTFAEMGPLMATMSDSAQCVFGDMIDQQAAWLGVPAVNTVGSGHIRTAIPNSVGSFVAFTVLAPWLLRYLPQAGGLEMSCDMPPGCKVVDAEGQVLAGLGRAQDEGLVVAEVTLARERPRPQRAQPPSTVSWLTYLVSDGILPALSAPVYRRGLRQAWGPEMAPPRVPRRGWLLLAVVLASGLLGGLLTVLLRRNRSCRRRSRKGGNSQG